MTDCGGWALGYALELERFWEVYTGFSRSLHMGHSAGWEGIAFLAQLLETESSSTRSLLLARLCLLLDQRDEQTRQLQLAHLLGRDGSKFLYTPTRNTTSLSAQ
jgi:hypothetical protein